MLGLITGLNRIPMMIVGVIAAVSAFYGWLLVHDHNLKNEIITEFNQQQEQLIAEKQKEFAIQLEELQKQNFILFSKSKEKEIVIEKEIITIEKEIDTKDKTSDAPLYYKQLMEKMQKNFGEKR
jgi:predicted metal-dependent hydrolase